ncbi:MAG: 30S ribosomal protein S5, partial [Erythrobacter sp. 34-65-8]
MMADENNTENTAGQAPVVDNAGETPVANLAPSEAGESQSPAGGDPSEPRRGRGRGGGGGDNRGGGGGDRGRGRGGRRDDRRGGREEEDDGIIEKLVHINRVSKTVKGG